MKIKCNFLLIGRLIVWQNLVQQQQCRAQEILNWRNFTAARSYNYNLPASDRSIKARPLERVRSSPRKLIRCEVGFSPPKRE